MKIALATDDNYVLGTMVLLTSLVPDLRSISWSVDLYFLEGGHLSARSLSLLKRFCEEEGIRVSFVGVKDPAVPSKRHHNSTTLCKFEVLRGVDEPTLWLDVDMVSAEGAITELIEQLNSLPQGRLLVARRPNVETHKFNAGMFAARDSFDVEWRSKLDDSLPTFEQHIFQETFKDSIFQVDSSFNVVNWWGAPSPEAAKLLHCAGPIKPWHFLGENFQRCLDEQCPWSVWYKNFIALRNSHPELSAEAEGLIRRPAGMTVMPRLFLSAVEKTERMPSRIGDMVLSFLKAVLFLSGPFTRLNYRYCHPIH